MCGIFCLMERRGLIKYNMRKSDKVAENGTRCYLKSMQAQFVPRAVRRQSPKQEACSNCCLEPIAELMGHAKLPRDSFPLLLTSFLFPSSAFDTDAAMAWFDSRTLFVSASLFCLPLLVVCAILCLPILAFATGNANTKLIQLTSEFSLYIYPW